MKRIISGFPCIGKSYVARLNTDMVSDSDSSEFSWLKGEPKKRNPDFPNNYIEHIISSDKRIVLVSSHKEVRDALTEHNLPWILVYPNRGLKIEYCYKAINRGSPQEFRSMLMNRWDSFIDEMEQETRCQIKIELGSDMNLMDVINLGSPIHKQR